MSKFAAQFEASRAPRAASQPASRFAPGEVVNAGVLWKGRTKADDLMFSGTIFNLKVALFPNRNSTNPKAPTFWTSITRPLTADEIRDGIESPRVPGWGFWEQEAADGTIFLSSIATKSDAARPGVVIEIWPIKKRVQAGNAPDMEVLVRNIEPRPAAAGEPQTSTASRPPAEEPRTETEPAPTPGQPEEIPF